ncbi:GNAT family N-acetyltransferase [Bacillus sp. UNCCL81]|uniref:GNAT family N-acetyltransferase n=1 Tax=Bacillus sp. UNCCL81 TaxID=1502755 RepID=UPI00336A2329
MVGACGYYFPEINLGGISWIFTDPNYKGKKISSKLVKHCIDKIQMNRSITKIEVRTSQFANVFFEKMGFRTQLVKQDYWAKGYDLYAMTMPVLINNITLE